MRPSSASLPACLLLTLMARLACFEGAEPCSHMHQTKQPLSIILVMYTYILYSLLPAFKRVIMSPMPAYSVIQALFENRARLSSSLIGQCHGYGHVTRANTVFKLCTCLSCVSMRASSANNVLRHGPEDRL